MSRRRAWRALAASALLLAAGAAARADGVTTITVVPFAALGGEREAWLGKGIADRLMRALGEVASLVVLERDRLQTFLAEMELRESGFFDQGAALRVGQVARVEQVVYGNYSLGGGRLAINLVAVDLASGESFARHRVEGPLDTLQGLTGELALAFLAGTGHEPDPHESGRLSFAPTDSLPAVEHFYRGIDHHDAGRVAEAFGEFYAASRRDPAYLEARLWMGRMLEAAGQPALAVGAYRALHREASGRVEGLDALLLAAKLLEADRPLAAIEAYRTLAAARPVTPHGLIASFRLGLLHRDRGEPRAAFEALAHLDRFRARIERERPRAERGRAAPTLVPRRARHAAGIRQSRFFRWPRALGLYRDAVMAMSGAYARLARTEDAGELPPAPRGVFLLDPGSPAVVERRFGRSPALFHEQHQGSGWREAFYVVVVPRGFVATGVEMRIGGRVHEVRSEVSYAMRVLPFPLPPGYENAWLGTVYGQTRKLERLRKRVPFYGHGQRVLTVQLIENRSEIRDWALAVTLRAEPEPMDPPPAAAGPASGEGRVLGRVALGEQSFAGIAKPSFRHVYAPRNRLALARTAEGPRLVSVRGELGGEQTDLWWSHSRDGKRWSTLEPLPVNSASDDFAPRLVRAEDGGLRLFWLSDRRGLGWEIWTAESPAGDGPWSNAARVPVEALVPAGPGERDRELATGLLPYAVTQDGRGRWLLAYFSPASSELVVAIAEDASTWRVAARLETGGALYSPALVEDRAGVYRLAAFGADGLVHLWSASEPGTWRRRSFEVNDYRYPEIATIHPMELHAEPDGRLLLLMSDGTFGLQYARFAPDTGEPRLDLVKGAGLESYAAARDAGGGYLVALRRNGAIDVARYERFHSPLNAPNPRRSPIYVETTADQPGQRWDRIFARARFIAPDVTAVGSGGDGRIWWGIESGVMALKGEQFFFADVAKGFFHHHVTDIAPCGTEVAFASRFLDEPVLGLAAPGGGARGMAVRSRRLDGARGNITALACGERGRLHVATGAGDLVTVRGDDTVQRLRLPNAVPSALAASRDGGLWVGTVSGELYTVDGEAHRVATPASARGRVHALAVDRDGALWAAFGDTGLHRLDGGRWVHIPASPSGLPYPVVGALAADRDAGVWLIPGPERRSSGLVHVDGERVRIHTPPGDGLLAPTGLSVGADGDVWVGTAFHGVYRLATVRS